MRQRKPFKPFLLIPPILLLLIGCSTIPPTEKWEVLLNRAKTPITVISISQNNPTCVLFRDARGTYFSVEGHYLGSLKVGDKLY